MEIPPPQALSPCRPWRRRSSSTRRRPAWPPPRGRHALGAALALTALLSGIRGPDPLQGAALEFPLVFTQIPAGAEKPAKPGRAESQEAVPTSGLLAAVPAEGARIALLDPGGRLQVLTAGFASACDPDVSFDGDRLVFSGKKAAGDPWNIWQIRADGSGERQVTREPRDCRSPIYLSSLYTITSATPWYTVIFTGTGDTLNEARSGPSASLHSVRLDGTELARITFNPSDERDPCQLPDGRVIFSSWSYEPVTGGTARLFAANIDGTDGALYASGGGERIQRMPCVTPRGLVVFVESALARWDGAGRLAAVRLERPHHSYHVLPRGEDGLYHSPSALPDGSLLVARRPAHGGGSHGLYRLDPATGEREEIFDDPRWHDIEPRALLSRPEPDGRSSVVSPTKRTGKLYCLNVGDADAALRPSYLAPGTVARVRVIEPVPLSAPGGADREGAGSVTLGESLLSNPGLPPRAARRLLGVAPVEGDGSFHLEIPADVPVELQILDADGLALATCRWTWARPGERRGCIGCHEDPELTPENYHAAALGRPANRLVLPPGRRRTVTFQDHVLPIIRERCAQAECHAGGDTPLQLASRPGGPGPHEAHRAYAALVGELPPGSSAPRGARTVDPGRARASYLVWRLFGRDTSRPWDRSGRGAGAEPLRPMPPPGKAAPLSDEERRTFVEWIDLGAQEGGPSRPRRFPDDRQASENP